MFIFHEVLIIFATHFVQAVIIAKYLFERKIDVFIYQDVVLLLTLPYRFSMIRTALTKDTLFLERFGEVPNETGAGKTLR